MRLAVICHDPERRAALAARLGRLAGQEARPVACYDSYEVFQGRFRGADLVFLGIESMNYLEAGRKLARFFPGSPLVVVSSSREYSVEALALGARDYLPYPPGNEALLAALAGAAASDTML